MHTEEDTLTPKSKFTAKRPGFNFPDSITVMNDETRNKPSFLELEKCFSPASLAPMRPLASCLIKPQSP